MKPIHLSMIISFAAATPAFAQTKEEVLGPFDTKNLEMFPEKARLSFFVLSQFDGLRSDYLKLRNEVTSTKGPKQNQESIARSLIAISKKNSDTCTVIRSHEEKLIGEARDAADALFKLKQILAPFQAKLRSAIEGAPEGGFDIPLKEIISTIESKNPDFVSGKIRISNRPIPK